MGKFFASLGPRLEAGVRQRPDSEGIDCFVASWLLAKIRLRFVDGDDTATKYKRAKMTHSASVSGRLMVRSVFDAVH